MGQFSDVSVNPNQGLLNQLQASQLQTAMLGMQEQADLQQKSNEEKQYLKELVKLYNSNPASLNDMQVAYLKQAAPAVGADMSIGAQADRGGHGWSKALGFGAGVADSILFDLIPDKAYINRYNKGWSSAGKWAGTIGSLAIGGAGAYNAIKGARSLSAIAKVASANADDVLKAVAGNTDDVARVFGSADEFGKLGSGAEGLKKLADATAKTSNQLKVDAMALSKKINPKGVMKYGEFEKSIVDKKGLVHEASKSFKPSTEAGRAIVNRRWIAHNKEISNLDNLEKLIPTSGETLTANIAKNAKDRTTKLTGLVKEIDDMLANPALTEAQVTKLTAGKAKYQEEIGLLTKLIRKPNLKKEVAKQLKSAEYNKAALAELRAKAASLDNITKTVKDTWKTTKVVDKDLVKETGSKLARYYETVASGAKDTNLKKELSNAIKEMSLPEAKRLVATAEEHVATAMKGTIEKTAGPLGSIIDDLATNTLSAKQKKAIEILKIAKELTKAKSRNAWVTRNASNLTAPGMSRTAMEAIAGIGTKGSVMKGIGGLVAIPMIASPAIRSMAPMSVEQASMNGDNMFNGNFSPSSFVPNMFMPGVQQANMSSLPYGGQIPLTPMQMQNQNDLQQIMSK